MGSATCHLRFAHDMVFEFPLLLPRGVTVAQVTLDHFVMVRIHARQHLFYRQALALRPSFKALSASLWPISNPFYGMLFGMNSLCNERKRDRNAILATVIPLNDLTDLD
jgi:hypothetical protein